MDTKVKERDSNLDWLGFPSYKAYVDGPLWRVIYEEVLRRDNGRCRALDCESEASRAYLLSVSHSALLGIAPECVVLMCDSCRRYCLTGWDGRRLTLEQTILCMLRKVSGLKAVPGESSPEIGRWWGRVGWESRPVAETIANRVEEALPKFHKKFQTYYNKARLRARSYRERQEASG